MSGYFEDEMILKVKLCVLDHRTRIIVVLHELGPLMRGLQVTCWNLDELLVRII